MGSEHLRQLLTQLHEGLADADTLDIETRELLTTVMRDIERALARNESAAVPGGIDSLAIKLQAEHPTLAGALQQLIDALAKAGI